MNTLESYVPLYIFIGIVMLSVVITIGLIYIIFKMPMRKQRGNTSDNSYHKINIIKNVQEVNKCSNNINIWRLVIFGLKDRIGKFQSIGKEAYKQKGSRYSEDRYRENESKFHTSIIGRVKNLRQPKKNDTTQKATILPLSLSPGWLPACPRVCLTV